MKNFENRTDGGSFPSGPFKACGFLATKCTSRDNLYLIVYHCTASKGASFRLTLTDSGCGKQKKKRRRGRINDLYAYY